MKGCPSFCVYAGLQITTLFVKIVLVCADRQLVARSLVTNHDSVWVHLQHG